MLPSSLRSSPVVNMLLFKLLLEPREGRRRGEARGGPEQVRGARARLEVDGAELRAAGEELVMTYGDEYWSSRGVVPLEDD